ncbi:MAG: hypothetical protein Q7T97_10390 [Burkholderiaceae bacterium]|nr:hypothetical protein [Burkholderiaceae bacterium]
MRVTMPSQFVEGAASGATSAVEQIDRAEEAHHHLNEAAHDLADRARPAIDRLVKSAENLAQRGIDGARDGSQHLRDRAARATDCTVNYIKDEPVKSMLIAAATGAALMALVALLNRSRQNA